MPRYYENNMATTITMKGTRDVLLSNSSSSHKRVTVTPIISASGKMPIKHVLFPKLKKVPAHDARCDADVNETGMWNYAHVRKYVDKLVASSRTIFERNAAVLIIMDSYTTHIKFVNENKDAYEADNVHFAIVPKCMTGLLQPLDVAINRSLQQFFNDRTTEYQEESLSQNKNQTKAGNIKIPSSTDITKWIADWADTVPPEQISKAFDLCGLVPAGE